MEFLTWHYTVGLRSYIQIWVHQVDWTIHYFSPGILLKTLFSPWKKLVIVDDKPGFNLGRSFEAFTYNIISRGMGFIVRSALIVVGFFSVIFTMAAGVLAVLVWLILPPVGLMIYSKYQKRPSRIARKTYEKAKKAKKKLKAVFSSEPGEFVLARLGVSLDDIVGSAKNDVELASEPPISFTELMESVVKSGVWTKDTLRKLKLEENDFLVASTWWDAQRSQELHIDQDFGRPGIGLELLHGYTPTLNQYSTDLSSPKSYSHHLIGREVVVSQMERNLKSGQSVILQGQPGVGKRTVVLEFAHRAANGKLGEKMAYRRILELDHNSLLSNSKDINEKKTKFAEVLEEAAYAGNIILMIRDLHRITNKEVEGYDFTDVIEGHLQKGDLKIIAVTTNVEYERFIAPNMRLRKHFEVVDVEQPNKEDAMTILVDFSVGAEMVNGVTITVPALRKILDESDRFITDIPFPEKALELLDAVIIYRKQLGDGNIVKPDDVSFVLSEKVGISFAALTDSEKKKLSSLEDIIHEKLIDQVNAVNSIARSLRARTVGVAKEGKPIGSFLFLGPTGVGKTETAKVLSEVYFGSQENILRFNMAEYAGREGLERLIGSVDKNQPGVLTTGIKNKPASLLLLDEIEKSPKDIFNLFLSLLDEGKMKDAFDKEINGRNLFIIGTSNAGAEYIRKLVNDGVKGEELQAKVTEHVLENHLFSPEFINRFDAVVVYEPLGMDELIQIARLQVRTLSENMRKKGVNVEFTDEAIKQIAEDGYDPAFGARPMQRIIDLSIGDMISKSLLADETKEGDRIRILPGGSKGEYSLEKVGENE